MHYESARRDAGPLEKSESIARNPHNTNSLPMIKGSPDPGRWPWLVWAATLVLRNGQKVTSQFGMVLVFGPTARDSTAQSEGLGSSLQIIFAFRPERP